MTGGADDLALELALGRVPLARGRPRREEERREERYDSSAPWMHESSVSRVTAPGT